MRRAHFLALSCAAVVFASGTITSAVEEPAGSGQNGIPVTPNNQGKPNHAAMEERLNGAWNTMPLEEKSRVMRLHRGLRILPPEERKAINDKIDHFLNMSPQERQKLQQNYQRWQQMTPQERQRAREEFNKRRKAFEEKWRKEHPGEEPPPFLPRRGGPANRPGSSPPAQSPHEGEQSISPVPQAE